jgi:hypothetical protein
MHLLFLDAVANQPKNEIDQSIHGVVMLLASKPE